MNPFKMWVPEPPPRLIAILLCLVWAGLMWQGMWLLIALIP